MAPSADAAPRVGPKSPIVAGTAVAASQHPAVTQTMLDVLDEGGNAADAAVAGCLVQGTVQQDMTNHAGTITMLYWDAQTRDIYELNSTGTIVPGLPPFHRVPPGYGLYSALAPGPFAVIPGFMPGIKAIFEKFATLDWARLCAPAIQWAKDGHVVDSFEHLVMAQTVDFYLYTESGRAHFTPEGHLPQVGDRWAQPELAETLRRLAAEGPDYFITGAWARAFVARANDLGWKIRLENLTEVPPRWGNGTPYRHRGHEIVQLSPPERQAAFCGLVLGIVEELDLPSFGHYTESAEALYYLAHALRRAGFECGLIQDPHLFANCIDELLDASLHRRFADLLRGSRPQADLSEHVRLVAPVGALPNDRAGARQPAGSCEISVVDRYGNWLQMMNTLQSGGIPGEVVGGVPMVGSHALPRLDAPISGWFAGGGRIRSVMGNTMVLRDGEPWLSLGTPGNVHCTVPQVLANILDYGMDPYAAEDAPRMLPLEEDFRVAVEARLPDVVVLDAARLGLLVRPLPRYDYHMGSFQMSWRDGTGGLHATVGPRRAGLAAGL